MSIARLIRVERQGKSARLFIDGEEFPWAIGRTSISTFVDPDDVPSVAVEIPADRVEIVDAWRTET